MFSKCKSQEEALDLFEKLEPLLLPEKGGSEELYQLLHKSYEEIIMILEGIEDLKPKPESSNNIYSKVYQKVKIGDKKAKILDDIISMLPTHRDFNSSFVKSVLEFFDRNGYVTFSQYNGLVKVYYFLKSRE